MGSSGGERFAGHGLPDSDRARLRAICWYLTLGGCHVAVFATDESSFNYRCEGCNAQPYRAGGRLQALSRANQHAAQCRAARSQHYRDAAEIAREVTTDVRAELPRVDARAAAGIALFAAVLIGTVGQQPRTMPLLAFAVNGAGLLTIALLLFFAVLLPVSGKAAWASARRWATFENGEAMAGELADIERAVFYATTAIELSSIVRAKQMRLTLALCVTGLAVLALASGASISLFLGSR